MNLNLATTSGTLIAGKLSPNSTTFIDGGLILTDSINANSIKAGSVTAAQIAGNTITAAQIAGDSITGDKIKANTEISAPTIKGGNINIGNGNFVVDQWGNLTANSGTFKGTVLAENISGKIDVKSLKKSAIMNGYRMYFAMDQVPEGTTFQKILNAYNVNVFYTQRYELLSADYVSKRGYILLLWYKECRCRGYMFSLTVECVKSKTVAQKVLTVDDYVDLVVETFSGVEIYKQLNIGYGRVQKKFLLP